MRRDVLLLVTGLFSGLAGCGYTTQRPFPTDIRTIHVEMFHTKEFRRELEFRLTEALIKRIEMDTPYRIAPKRTADAVLSGEILSVENRTIGDELAGDLPREIGSTLTVRFRLQDLRSGKTVIGRQRSVYQASYIPRLGESFTQGMTRAVEGMASAIVEEMESDW